jgi:hypothetical protein
MTDTKRWTRRGSTFQRLAGARLMDVDPVRVEALDLRIVAALKRGKLKPARDLLTRRLALCERVNDDAMTRKIIEDLANEIDDAIAKGMTEEQILAYHRRRAQEQSDSDGCLSR